MYLLCSLHTQNLKFFGLGGFLRGRVWRSLDSCINLVCLACKRGLKLDATCLSIDRCVAMEKSLEGGRQLLVYPPIVDRPTSSCRAFHCFQAWQLPRNCKASAECEHFGSCHDSWLMSQVFSSSFTWCLLLEIATRRRDVPTRAMG